MNIAKFMKSKNAIAQYNMAISKAHIPTVWKISLSQIFEIPYLLHIQLGCTKPDENQVVAKKSAVSNTNSTRNSSNAMRKIKNSGFVRRKYNPQHGLPDMFPG